ncbi:hypothetical protein CSKR_110386 [Clonorchis sinensis]|uniref:KN motif and ankyrin repeat domain-containing protein 1 n=1 Tax=Clonorchis sinensis TaxID=79923 RepID=A0A8T1M3H2_CLOSI|nr:hypothetical protein CSKR_110386 [Clonorchis sinensis]
MSRQARTQLPTPSKEHGSISITCIPRKPRKQLESTYITRDLTPEKPAEHIALEHIQSVDQMNLRTEQFLVVRDKLLASLSRVRELEKQVQAIPVLEAKIEELKLRLFKQIHKPLYKHSSGYPPLENVTAEADDQILKPYIVARSNTTYKAKANHSVPLNPFGDDVETDSELTDGRRVVTIDSDANFDIIASYATTEIAVQVPFTETIKKRRVAQNFNSHDCVQHFVNLLKTYVAKSKLYLNKSFNKEKLDKFTIHCNNLDWNQILQMLRILDLQSPSLPSPPPLDEPPWLPERDLGWCLHSSQLNNLPKQTGQPCEAVKLDCNNGDCISVNSNHSTLSPSSPPLHVCKLGEFQARLSRSYVFLTDVLLLSVTVKQQLYMAFASLCYRPQTLPVQQRFIQKHLCYLVIRQTRPISTDRFVPPSTVPVISRFGFRLQDCSMVKKPPTKTIERKLLQSEPYETSSWIATRDLSSTAISPTSANRSLLSKFNSPFIFLQVLDRVHRSFTYSVTETKEELVVAETEELFGHWSPASTHMHHCVLQPLCRTAQTLGSITGQGLNPVNCKHVMETWMTKKHTMETRMSINEGFISVPDLEERHSSHPDLMARRNEFMCLHQQQYPSKHSFGEMQQNDLNAPSIQFHNFGKGVFDPEQLTSLPFIEATSSSSHSCTPNTANHTSVSLSNHMVNDQTVTLPSDPSKLQADPKDITRVKSETRLNSRLNIPTTYDSKTDKSSEENEAKSELPNGKITWLSKHIRFARRTANQATESKECFKDEGSTGSGIISRTLPIKMKMWSCASKRPSEKPRKLDEPVSTPAQMDACGKIEEQAVEGPKDNSTSLVSLAFLNSCRTFAAWLEDSTNITSKVMNEATNTVRRIWFEVTSGPSSTGEQVEAHINALRSVPGCPVDRIVNMVDHKGNTAIHYAVSHARWSVVGALLKNCPGLDVDKFNHAGYTPTMLTAVVTDQPSNAEDMDSLNLLLSRAKLSLVSATSQKQSVLMLAAIHGRVALVHRLLQVHHAPINQTDAEGSTALMAAAEHNRSNVVRLILSQPDVNAEARDNDGCTALDIALARRHHEIALMIYAKVKMKKLVPKQIAGGNDASHTLGILKNTILGSLPVKTVPTLSP